MERYKEIERIGRGNYGTAFLCLNKTTGSEVVVKKIPLGLLSEKERSDAWSECRLLKHTNHPNIVKYIDSFLEDETLHIVTQYCDRGDLSAAIRKARLSNSFFSEDQILDWFIQITMAVDYIHSLRIMHRDLKTGNVFLTGNNVIKLGDFGIAKVLDSNLESAQTVVGTPFYMSPEVCENKPYDFKSDLWAMGCILYELCTLNHAFDASNLLGLVFKIVQETYPPIPDHYSDDLRTLVKKLLSKDPKNRPSCTRIFALPFIHRRLQKLAKGATLGQDPNLIEGREEDLTGPVHTSNSLVESVGSSIHQSGSSNSLNSITSHQTGGDINEISPDLPQNTSFESASDIAISTGTTTATSTTTTSNTSVAPSVKKSKKLRNAITSSPATSFVSSPSSSFQLSQSAPSAHSPTRRRRSSMDSPPMMSLNSGNSGSHFTSNLQLPSASSNPNTNVGSVSTTISGHRPQLSKGSINLAPHNKMVHASTMSSSNSSNSRHVRSHSSIVDDRISSKFQHHESDSTDYIVHSPKKKSNSSHIPSPLALNALVNNSNPLISGPKIPSPTNRDFLARIAQQRQIVARAAVQAAAQSRRQQSTSSTKKMSFRLSNLTLDGSDDMVIDSSNSISNTSIGRIRSYSGQLSSNFPNNLSSPSSNSAAGNVASGNSSPVIRRLRSDNSVSVNRRPSLIMSRPPSSSSLILNTQSAAASAAAASSQGLVMKPSESGDIGRVMEEVRRRSEDVEIHNVGIRYGRNNVEDEGHDDSDEYFFPTNLANKKSHSRHLSLGGRKVTAGERSLNPRRSTKTTISASSSSSLTTGAPPLLVRRASSGFTEEHEIRSLQQLSDSSSSTSTTLQQQNAGVEVDSSSTNENVTSTSSSSSSSPSQPAGTQAVIKISKSSKRASNRNKWFDYTIAERTRLRNALPDLFDEIYSRLCKFHAREVEPVQKKDDFVNERTKRELVALFGPENLQLCFEIDQLLYVEEYFLTNEERANAAMLTNPASSSPTDRTLSANENNTLQEHQILIT